MPDKIPPSTIEILDKALDDHRKAWERFKQTRRESDDVGFLDKEFYAFTTKWLELDNIFDKHLKAHTLTSWDDVDLISLTDQIRNIQARIAKMEGTQRKQAIDEVSKVIEGVYEKLRQ